MTPKQRVFVREYLIDLNGTQAAIRAGYSPRTAVKIGSENLLKPDIAREIQRAMDERSARTGVTAERVLQELARIAFLDIRKAFNPDGSMKPLDQLDDETAAAIAGLEVYEELDPDGVVVVGRVKKLKLSDKIGALQLLARHLGLLNDKLTLKGDAENPLTLLVKAVQGTSIKPVQTSAIAPALSTH
ncbi:terminase small subunit [Xanthobacter oligotrophicus]|uniref:terminase small subunit n=1 Tax=Xanthobacter oligotrophicus TaxID=2607286 RepID=UPI0011F0A8AA|nr:terminase small subunit [Xanthobacter oligotrophicus]MCG5235297.1 terminase small subunit [Xanthobacter oligotrophicus]